MCQGTRYFGVLLLLVSASAIAVEIEFEEASGAGNPIVASHTEQEYSLSSSHMRIIGSPTLCQFGGCVETPAIKIPTEWSASGQYLAQEGGNLSATVTISLLSNSIFNLRHFSVAELFLDDAAASIGGFRNASTVTITGTRYQTALDAKLGQNAEIVTASFTLDGIKDGAGGVDDFQSIAPPSLRPTDPNYSRYYMGEVFRNVASVTFSADGAFALDNIRVTQAPEPATWALFLLGLTSLVYFRRRTTHAAKIAA